MMEPAEIWEGYPGWVESLVRAKLQPDETPLAWFEPDLTPRLHYAAGLVVLTNRRVLGFEWEPGARPNAKPPVDPKASKKKKSSTADDLPPESDGGPHRASSRP